MEAVKELAETILDTVSFAVVQTKADVVVGAIEDAVLHKRNGSKYASAGGISIYWPVSYQGYTPEMFYYSYLDEIIDFPTDSSWRQFLYVFYNVMQYQGVIEPQIYTVKNTLTYFDSTSVDLYDFCKGLVDYQAP